MVLGGQAVIVCQIQRWQFYLILSTQYWPRVLGCIIWLYHKWVSTLMAVTSTGVRHHTNSYLELKHKSERRASHSNILIILHS